MKLRYIISIALIMTAILVAGCTGSQNVPAQSTPTAQPLTTATPTPIPESTASPSVGASTPTPVPSIAPTSTPDSGIKQTEFGYYITYPPLGPEVWSNNSPPIVHPVVTNPADVWAGVWDTDWNNMTLQVNGDHVFGIYDYMSGTIDGYVSGNVLTGTWTQSNGQGDISFTVSDDGTSFSGNWRYGHSDDPNAGWDGTWAGTKY